MLATLRGVVDVARGDSYRFVGKIDGGCSIGGGNHESLAEGFRITVNDLLVVSIMNQLIYRLSMVHDSLLLPHGQERGPAWPRGRSHEP